MAERGQQPTYKRQRFLLAFVRQLKDGVSSTDLQKLVFLYSMETGLNHYEFMPYKYGAYSFQLAADVDTLRRAGYLSAGRIRARGRSSLEQSFMIATERGKDLIRKAYRAYPYYAINSEIIDKLFEGDEAERFRRIRDDYARTEQVMFTIGYEGKSVEAFINELIRSDVRLLIDVRRNPLSRKFGFSKTKLEHIAGVAGIEYIHIPELGIDTARRSSLETVADYRCLLGEYEKTLSKYTPQLDRLYSLLP